MKLLIESNAFYPSVGGIQILTRDLCEEWVRQGHDVIVQTEEPLDGKDELDSLHVVRRPNLFQRLTLLRWSDIYAQTAVSLKGALIAFGIGSDVVFIHNEHLREGDNLRDYIQKYILSRGHNIAVSNALGKALPVETTVIPNPVPRHFDKYQPGYKQHDDSQRYLLFVGRLAKSKGCDIAIRAFARVHSDRDSLRFKICGDGDQRGRLEALSHNLNMDASVEFHGWVNRSRLVPMLTNASAVLVPSRGPEAFGLVALESIACGTPVVASRLGGLPEAVGECGTLVKPDDVDAMVKGIKATLDTSGSRRLAEEMAKHTNRHSIASVADRYIDEFYGLVRKDHNR